MVTKTIPLTDFSDARTALQNTIARKIHSLKVNGINTAINPKLKIEINVVANLLNGIEAKFRKCESIYAAYFQDISHPILSGDPRGLPYIMDCTFIGATGQTKYLYNCDDKLLYKELIDMNFQHFILMTASIYENLVILAETVLKKVIVHIKGRGPASEPLHDYLKFLNILISLGYRSNDEITSCLSTFNTYFDSHLITINQLRNRFIHGYSINLASDSSTYKITHFADGAFTLASPELDLDVFTGKVLENTRNFILAFYPALDKSIRHYRKSLPA